jgi:kynurenine formamidase
LDKIPESHLINVPSVIVDVEEAVDNSSLPSQFLLDVKHLIDHEKVYGEIPKGSVVLIHSGWSKYWPDKVRYLGWDNSTEGKSPVNFPGE